MRPRRADLVVPSVRASQDSGAEFRDDDARKNEGLLEKTSLDGLEQDSLRREIWDLALPTLLTLIVEPLMTLVDTILIARILSWDAVAALSGVGVASVCFKFAFALFNFLAVSLIPLTAEATNERDKQQVVLAAVQLAVICGTLVGAVLFGFAPQIVNWFAGTADLSSASMRQYAIDYIRYRAFGAPFVLFGYVASAACRGMQDTRSPLLASIASNVTNLGLDVLLMTTFGMGVAGASLATGISQGVLAAVLLATLLKARVLPGSWRSYLTIVDARRFAAVAESGVLSVRTFSILFTQTLAGLFATRLGSAAMAAYSVARQVWLFQSIALDALAITATSLVSRELGLEKQKLARQRAKVVSDAVLRWAVLIGAALGAATFIGAEQIARMFISTSSDAMATAEALQNVIPLLRVAAVLQPLAALVFVLDGIFASFTTEYNYVSASVLVAGMIASGTIVAGVVWLKRGLMGVWLGFNVLMLGRASALGLRYAFGWKQMVRKHHEAKS
ncbi:Protein DETOXIFICATION 44, chloroplastic [Porphyridium purpureum]|uniref:Protein DETOXIFICATION 44, chloroplastic n=1 Tax=Porphyridium purpureum TaxID=35688 RepID=A0A5J4YHP3_PORPP|nr:Protein DETOXIFICATION 44, chloroplastic [Porphyridium purpureum]|eukprot:POR2674..scf289_17